jgi:hypothetical protein
LNKLLLSFFHLHITSTHHIRIRVSAPLLSSPFLNTPLIYLRVYPNTLNTQSRPPVLSSSPPHPINSVTRNHRIRSSRYRSVSTSAAHSSSAVRPSNCVHASSDHINEPVASTPVSSMSEPTRRGFRRGVVGWAHFGHVGGVLGGRRDWGVLVWWGMEQHSPDRSWFLLWREVMFMAVIIRLK